MSRYYRPLVQHGGLRPPGAVDLAGGPLWFTHAEELCRTGSRIVPAQAIPSHWLTRLTAPRPPIAGLDMSHPHLMGILNVTPDSFSDGGDFAAPDVAMAQARRMAQDGAAIVDIGGESTRPGAEYIPPDQEIARTAPIIAALRGDSDVPISIDTRKSAVARAALAAGADLVNDVSGFLHDPDLLAVCAEANVPVCVMHAQGDPATMQANPHYDNVLLDVYDFLAGRVAALEQAGIARARIMVDPGIGFGKTVPHNLALLQNIALFHGLGCAILLGVSRKKFIGTLGNAPPAKDRMPGSVAVGLAALAQGVQLLRVHDVRETAQALRLWAAAR